MTHAPAGADPAVVGPYLATALAVPVLTSTGTDHGGSECYTSFPLRFVEPATD